MNIDLLHYELDLDKKYKGKGLHIIPIIRKSTETHSLGETLLWEGIDLKEVIVEEQEGSYTVPSVTVTNKGKKRTLGIREILYEVEDKIVIFSIVLSLLLKVLSIYLCSVSKQEDGIQKKNRTLRV